MELVKDHYLAPQFIQLPTIKTYLQIGLSQPFVLFLLLLFLSLIIIIMTIIVMITACYIIITWLLFAAGCIAL